jgi:hypothetical protein
MACLRYASRRPQDAQEVADAWENAKPQAAGDFADLDGAKVSRAAFLVEFQLARPPAVGQAPIIADSGRWNASAPLDGRKEADKMRKLLLVGVLVLAGCQNVAGPFAARPPQRVDDPHLSIPEQQYRGRDRLALPDETSGAPPSGASIPGQLAPLRN